MSAANDPNVKIRLIGTGAVRAHTSKIDYLPEITQAASGWNTSLLQLMKTGGRATTPTRCFDINRGHASEENPLPDI